MHEQGFGRALNCIDPNLLPAVGAGNSPQKRISQVPIVEAKCIGSRDGPLVKNIVRQDRQPLPVAQCINIDPHPSSIRCCERNSIVDVQAVDLSLDNVPSGTCSASDCFDTPSVQSFVTPENEQVNRSLFKSTSTSVPIINGDAEREYSYLTHLLPTSCQRCSYQRCDGRSSITGEELLSRLKQQRKKKTWRVGLIGGVAGLFLGGPIGAVCIGAGSALITKRRLKRRENCLRRQLDGRLLQPLPVVPRSAIQP